MSHYADESSHLSELRCLLTFPILHLRNLFKRIVYNYFLRNFSIASIDQWLESARTGVTATAGTVMLSALPSLLGLQLLLNFLAYDMSMTPEEAVQRRLSRLRVLAPSEVAE